MGKSRRKGEVFRGAMREAPHASGSGRAGAGRDERGAGGGWCRARREQLGGARRAEAERGTERSPFLTDEEIAGEERSRAGVALPGWSRREMRRRGWSRPVLQGDEGSGGAGPDGRRPRGAAAAERSSASQTRVSWPGPVRAGRAGPDLSPETHTPARPPPGLASRLSRQLTASPS